MMIKNLTKGSGLTKHGFFKAAALLVCSLAFLAACSPVNYAAKAPIDKDVSERAPKSIKIDVQDFSWSYAGGDRIRVTATVKNNTGRSQSGLTIFAMLFDENGTGVALGESFISPPYLSAGTSGTIEFTARTSRPAGLKHIRLLTNAVKE